MRIILDFKGCLKLYPINDILPLKEAAELAIVNESASALSGDLIPRFRISSLLSSFIFPDEVYL